VGVRFLFNELESADAQAWISIEGYQQEQEMRWQTKEGIHQKKLKQLLPGMGKVWYTPPGSWLEICKLQAS